MHRSDIDWHTEQVNRAVAAVDARHPEFSRKKSPLRRAGAVLSEFLKLCLILAIFFAIGAYLGSPT